jgi:hypothetical protein
MTTSNKRTLTLVAAALGVAASSSCTRVPPRGTPSVSTPQRTISWRPANPRLLTRWAAGVRPDAVLPEYPRPQMVRSRWQNLNGLWQFATVQDSGAVASLIGTDLPDQILVPFAMESSLSGVGRHADRVVYRRTFREPDMDRSERLLLHFGAIDWQSSVYVNGRRLADHTGGYDAFTVDITDALRDDLLEQEIVVAVHDPTDYWGQPRGKQVSNPEGIWYTPVTGIWQSVWLEPVPAASIDGLRMTPDVDAGVLRLSVRGRGTRAGQRIEARAMTDGRVIGRASGAVGSELRLPVPSARLWSPDSPYLYDLQVSLLDGEQEVDRVDSYFGMRKIGLMRDANGNQRIALNGRPVFQLGPLDQGWWPDGLYTAPTDDALRFDIETMKQLGFNMVRKHIKVEPARWYYWADRLGLAVWQDMPSGWNDSRDAQWHFERELRLMLDDLHNVPSIVMWVPFNEKWGQFDTRRIVGIIEQTDPSRLVNDASGWQHEDVGDVIDVHRYQGPQAMRGTDRRVAVVGEYGGLGHKVAGHTWAPDGWGYAGLFDTREGLADRYDLLAKRLYRDRDTHGIGAGVYTQLTDVEVELNGFLTYDRQVLKFDAERTAAVNRGLAPYLLPELVDFTDTVRVTIVQGTPTEIRYTIDGSEPTAGSPVYRGPFTLRQSTTVRARSFIGGRPTAAPEARADYLRGPGRPALALGRADVAPGLDYEYYADTTTEPAFRMNWPVRWRVERLEERPEDPRPKRMGAVSNFTLVPRDTNEMFSFRYRGYFSAPRTGVYTFTALSDDGAGLWVGDQNVFWSVGQSPKTTETWGQIALQAGLHPITVGYFQGYGPMELQMLVDGPGIRRQRIPDSMLFRDRRDGIPVRKGQ